MSKQSEYHEILRNAPEVARLIHAMLQEGRSATKISYWGSRDGVEISVQHKPLNDGGHDVRRLFGESFAQAVVAMFEDLLARAFCLLADRLRNARKEADDEALEFLRAEKARLPHSEEPEEKSNG